MTGLRWALLGASDIAATRMIPALRRCGGTIAAVVSGCPDRAARFAAAHAIDVTTTDLSKGLAGVDAVYVSSRNEVHAAQARAAIDAGVHVLCEKPVALDVGEAVALAAAADTAGLVLAVNHHLPCSAVVRRVAALAADGDLGDILGIRVAHAVHLPERLRGWRLGDAPGDGVVLDITCHDASVLNRIAGAQPLRATALTARQGRWDARSPDAAMAVLAYPGSILAQVHDAFTVPFARTGLEVHGSAASVYALDVMTQDPRGEILLVDGTGTRTVDVVGREDLYDVSVRAFTSATRGDGRPVVTGWQGAQYVAVALAVAAAAAGGLTVTVADVPDHPATAAAGGSLR